MKQWDALVRTALLGTFREQLPPDFTQGEVKSLLNRLPDSRPAHRLLASAGTQDLYEQVGRTPAKSLDETPLRASVVADWPPCSPQAAYYLKRMLSGPRRSLLPEFLQALLQSGQRVPDILLPNLLAHGSRVVADRPHIIAVLRFHKFSPPSLGSGSAAAAGSVPASTGSASTLLAAANPAWSYASPEVESWRGLRRIWETLPPVKRQSLVKQLRLSTPDLARQLVESTWKSDLDPQRMRLLKTLEAGLTLNDEPFLEMVLDDRSQQVRRQAAALLAYLPQSRLAQRMSRRAERYLTWQPDQERPINVRFLPVSPAMVRDGVFGSKSKNLARVRAQQLIQIVGAIPLSYWTEQWQTAPQTILQALINTNWTRTLFAGLTWAAFRQNHAVWAKEIIAIRGLDGSTSKLVDLLSPKDFGQLVRSASRHDGSDPFERRSPLLKALHRRTHPFDVAMAQFLLPLFATHFRENKTRAPGSQVRSSFLKIARTCTEDISDLTVGRFDQIGPQWQTTVVEFLDILKFRREMLEAIDRRR